MKTISLKILIFLHHLKYRHFWWTFLFESIRWIYRYFSKTETDWTVSLISANAEQLLIFQKTINNSYIIYIFLKCNIYLVLLLFESKK